MTNPLQKPEASKPTQAAKPELRAVAHQDGASAQNAVARPSDQAAKRAAQAKRKAAQEASEKQTHEAPQIAIPTARMRPRHWVALLSFLALVLIPFIAVTAYLYTRAAPQYHSNVAFSIRSEETSSAAIGMIGALTQIGTGSASDADILFEYIRSQHIVERVDEDIDLRAIFNRAENDVVFRLGDDASIEALHTHWNRMLEVSYESSGGIITVRANAFDPEDARAISRAVLAESDLLVNRLSEQAREDAIRFAQEELAEAETNLRAMRERLADFRQSYNIVTPDGDVAGQSGLLNALQAELAQALVDRDVLTAFAGDEDQRVIQANRRIDAITARIAEERSGLDGAGVAASLPEVVGAYEELLVDLEFANTAYTQTLAGLASARAEARRQSRYLAAHIEPTLAQSALYPRRLLLAGLAGLFLMLGWGVVMLVYYNVRDNR